MRRKLLAPAALVAVLLVAPHAWAPPPVFRPAPPPPPPRPPVRPPITPVRPPVTVRPPSYVVPPALHISLEAARRRSAAEAAELLRQQSAASLSRAQRAALLNAITHDLLRQQQAASLAQLRQLRTDWVAVGPGAGLDPIVAMQLEAAESAAERLLLAEILQLVRDGQFVSADAKLLALESPRYLPATVVQALPDLRATLKRIVPFAQAQAQVKQGASYRGATDPLSGVPHDQRAVAVDEAVLAWGSLAKVRNLFESQPAADNLASMELALKGVATVHGVPLASKLRPELAARLILDGRADDAAILLEGEVDSTYAAEVLADLKAAILGRGEFTTAQVAAFVPADAKPPAQSVALLPPEQLAKWKPPARKPGVTTIDTAISDARKKLKGAVDVEVDINAAKVNAVADRIRAALAAEAAPLKAFLEKVEAAHGKALTPAERQLAVAAGSRGLTVAEVVGVLAVEADRPASAARLLASVPAFGDPGAFAAGVEISGRAPAGFAAHQDAGFKLGGVRDRARIRDAVGASLHAQAGAVVSGQEVADLDLATLETGVAKKLGLQDGEQLTPLEYVQALLDVCGDWANDRAHLAAAMRELNQTVTDIEAGEYGPADDELKELTTAVKTRRLLVQADKKRREAGLVIGCQLLGAYGPRAAPASDWLRSQSEGNDTPWRTEAATALKKISAK